MCEILEYIAVRLNIFVRLNINNEYSLPSQNFNMIGYKGKSMNKKSGTYFIKISNE